MNDDQYYKTVERIKLLSKMTVKNGCTPQEAITAIELAEELRSKLHERKTEESKKTARLTIEAWKKLQKKWYEDFHMDQHVGNYAVEADGGMIRIRRKDE